MNNYYNIYNVWVDEKGKIWQLFNYEDGIDQIIFEDTVFEKYGKKKIRFAENIVVENIDEDLFYDGF